MKPSSGEAHCGAEPGGSGAGSSDGTKGAASDDTSGRSSQATGPAPLDCQSCGVCCFGDEMWIHLLVDDDERLGDENVQRLTVLTHHGRGYIARSMRMVDGHCVAFRNDLGNGRCGCSVYEIRPQICRDFDAGSPGCLAARRRHGFAG